MNVRVPKKSTPSVGSVFFITLIVGFIEILVGAFALMEGLPRLLDDVLKTEYSTHPGYGACQSFTIFFFVLVNALKQYIRPVKV